MTEVTTAPAQATEAQSLAIPPATPSAPQTEAANDEKEPKWLPSRLERHTKSLLAQLGVEKFDDVKTAIAELKKRQDAEKTETERLVAQVADLTGKAQKVEALEAVLAARANAELSNLTEEQRAAVQLIAGDDAAKRINAIDALRPTWTAKAAAVAPIAAPASTAPASPPPAATATPTNNVLATYEQLSKTNPMAAAQYRVANWDAYLQAKNARG